ATWCVLAYRSGKDPTGGGAETMGGGVAASAFRCDDLSGLAESIRPFLSRFDVGGEAGPRGEHGEEPDALSYGANKGWIVVNWPLWFYSNALVGETVSRALETIATTVHVYDGDFWTHLLFDCGTLLDRFCSRPTYFGQSEAERQQQRREWQGDPARVARAFGVDVDLVHPYLCHVDDPTGEFSHRAFPDDRANLDDFWVFVD